MGKLFGIILLDGIIRSPFFKGGGWRVRVRGDVILQAEVRVMWPGAKACREAEQDREWKLQKDLSLRF